MKKMSHLDDLVGLAGGLAGLANDARQNLRVKKSKLRETLHATQDIQELKKHIERLEKRIEVLEAEGKKTS